MFAPYKEELLNDVPPFAASYHLYCPPTGVPATERLTAPWPQFSPLNTNGSLGITLTVAVTCVLFAEVQPSTVVTSTKKFCNVVTVVV